MENKELYKKVKKELVNFCEENNIFNNEINYHTFGTSNDIDFIVKLISSKIFIIKNNKFVDNWKNIDPLLFEKEQFIIALFDELSINYNEEFFLFNEDNGIIKTLILFLLKEYISKKIINDKNFIIQNYEKYYFILSFLNNEIWKLDKIKKIISKDEDISKVIFFKELLENKELAIPHIEKDIEIFYLLPDSLKNDREIVLEALKQDG
ncbi:DUF4116 domain-containing protein, partial [Mesomycoplasma molare]